MRCTSERGQITKLEKVATSHNCNFRGGGLVIFARKHEQKLSCLYSDCCAVLASNKKDFLQTKKSLAFIEFREAYKCTSAIHFGNCKMFVYLVALRPKSTAMVMAGRSVHLTTLFPGQA